MVSPSHDVTISAQTPVADLVLHVQLRDYAARASFEELHMRYSRSIYGHIKKLVGDQSVAEELHNDTFLAAWMKLPQKDPNAPFDRWLHRIAANHAIDYLRHQKKFTFVPLPKEEPEDEDYQATPPIVSPEPGVEDQVCDLDSVEQLLNQLSPTARLCLQLYVQWGFTQKEIAEMLSDGEKRVDPRRINDHIRRARKALRDLYPHLVNRHKSETRRFNK